MSRVKAPARERDRQYAEIVDSEFEAWFAERNPPAELRAEFYRCWHRAWVDGMVCGKRAAQNPAFSRACDELCKGER